jgi:RNA polymerase sigma factor (sigma-70 family)
VGNVGQAPTARDWAATLADFLSSDLERSKRAARVYAAVVVGTLRELRADASFSRDDFVAEVPLRLWKHGPRLRDPRASGGWTRRVTKNLYFDSVTRGPPTHPRDPDATDPAGALSLEPPVDEQVVTAQVHEALRQAISGLQRRYRNVIQVLYFGHMTISEAAAALGVEEHTVRNHLRAAKSILRRRLSRFKRPQAALFDGGLR